MEALLIIGAIVAFWLLTCWIKPYTHCRNGCKGGKFFDGSGRNWGKCGKCGGSGKKIRLGRRLLGRTDHL